MGYSLTQDGSFQAWSDPAGAETNRGANDALYYLAYGRLFSPTSDGSLEPDLAESGEVVDENTIEITLRDGLTFSDGTPLDAAAAKAGLDRNIESENPNFTSSFFSATGVEVVSPTVFRITFEDGTAASWFDSFVSAWQTTIVKPGETDFDTPAGAGPLTVEIFERDRLLSMRKNDRYWDADEVELGGVDFVHSPYDPQFGMNALRADQVDVTFAEPAQIQTLDGPLEGYSMPSTNRTISMHICKKDGPLADAKVRVALNKAIDRDAINEAIFLGTAVPSTQVWPTGHQLNNPDVDEHLAYDPEGAKQLMEEAGYGDEVVSIDAHPLPIGGIVEVTEIMQDQLLEIGIQLNIMPASDYVNDYLAPQNPGIGLYPGNAVSGLQRLSAWTGTGIGNTCGFHDDEMEQYGARLAKLSASSDEAQDIWHQIDRKVTEEALGGFLFFRSFLAAYNTDHVGNLALVPTGSYVVPDPLSTYMKAN